MGNGRLRARVHGRTVDIAGQQRRPGATKPGGFRMSGAPVDLARILARIDQVAARVALVESIALGIAARLDGNYRDPARERDEGEDD